MAMIETGNGDRNGLAAEYVLGTLDEAERAQAEALFRADPSFAAEVEAWHRRFDPLLSAKAEPAPPGVLDDVFSSIDAVAQGQSAEIIQLRRREALWKWTAGAAAALAASLALFVAIRPLPQTAAPPFIAILESADRKEGFVATADLAQGGLYIRRVGSPPPPGRSFELWAIREGAAPEPLGIVDSSALIPTKTLAEKTGGAPLAKILLAITDEREGGAVDGKPSGAPIFSGKLIQTPES
jgi:anti-sigma-K factor RskA